MLMINNIKKKYSLDKRIDGTGLFLFRIFFSCLLFVEVNQMKFYQHLMFDELPFIQPSDLNFNVLFVCWQLAIFLLIIGFRTKEAVVVNFILSSFFFMTLSSFEYHVFYTYQAISFLLLFLPISRGLSIDSLFKKLKYSGPYQTYTPDTRVNVWSYYLPILLGLAFVYLDSVFYKLTSANIWLEGLGMWLPASLPQAVHVNLSWLLNQEYLVKFLGFLTIIFEGVFIFIFWFKKARIPLLIIGVGLHLGILIAFPIPLFALTAIGTYILLVPVHLWARFKKPKKELIKFYYDAECPLCIRTKIILSSICPKEKIGFYGIQAFAHQEPLLKDVALDILYQDIHGIKNNKVFKGVDLYSIIFLNTWYLLPLGVLLYMPGIKQLANTVYNWVVKNRVVERCNEQNCGYIPPQFPIEINNLKLFKNLTYGTLKSNLLFLFIGTCFFFQFLVTWCSPPIQNEMNKFSNTWLENINVFTDKVRLKLEPISLGMMGFTGHALFMDYHFKNYTEYYCLRDDKGELLPVYKENGLVENDNYGTNWRFFTFEVNGPNKHMDKVLDGYKRYLHFYVFNNHKFENNLCFDIVKRNIELPTKWEENFLNKMMKKPWQKVGKMGWKNGEFFIQLDED